MAKFRSIEEIEAPSGIVGVQLKGRVVDVLENTTFGTGLRVDEGGIIRPASGVTVTIERLRSAPANQWIDLSLGGLVTFAKGATPYLDPRWWGAAVDGETDDSVHVLAAGTIAKVTGIPVKLCGGDWLLGTPIINLAGATHSVRIYGEGVGITRIKRADRAIASSFARIFAVGNEAGYQIDVSFSDMSMDLNARGNPLRLSVTSTAGFQVGELVTGSTAGGGTIAAIEEGVLLLHPLTGSWVSGETVTGATSGTVTTTTAALSSFVWQQSHGIAIAPIGTLGVKEVRCENLSFTDPTADCVSVGGNSANSARDIFFTRIQSQDRTRARSDLVLTASFDRCVVSDCVLDKLEVETNSIDPTLAHNMTVSDTHVRSGLDLVCEGTEAAGIRSTLTCSNVVVGQKTMPGVMGIGQWNSHFSNCAFYLWSGTRFLQGRHEYRNCLFYAAPHPTRGFGEGRGLMYTLSAAGAEWAGFHGCTFDADPSLTTAQLQAFYWQEHWGKIHIVDCDFLPEAIPASRLRSGELYFELNRLRHNGNNVIQYSQPSTAVLRRFFFRNNKILHADGWLFQPMDTTIQTDIISEGNWSVTLGQIINWQNFSRLTPLRGGVSTGHHVLVVDDFQHNAEPTTGKWVRGQKVWNTNPSVGQPLGWICVTSGVAGSGAAFRPFGQAGPLTNIASTPSFVGQIAIASGEGYIATGVASAADWQQTTP